MICPLCNIKLLNMYENKNDLNSFLFTCDKCGLRSFQNLNSNFIYMCINFNNKIIFISFDKKKIALYDLNGCLLSESLKGENTFSYFKPTFDNINYELINNIYNYMIKKIIIS